MTKKASHPPLSTRKPIKLEWLKGVGRAVGNVAVIAAQHPAALALSIMAGCVVVRSAILAAGQGKESEKVKPIMGELSNLYNGSQGALTVLAVAPVVVSGLQAAGGAAAAMYGGASAKPAIPGKTPT